MTTEMALALIGFAFAMSISPGPSNFLLLVVRREFRLHPPGAAHLRLALKIVRSGSLGTSDGKMVAAPFTFSQAALPQLVNPKAWAVALVVTVSYTVPERFAASFLAMTFIFAAVNIPSISVWALSGAALHRRLSQGRRILAFNIAMAMLLVGSMMPVLLGAVGGV